MKKILLLILIYSNCKAQISEDIFDIKNGIEWFIDTTKSMSNESISQYYVYTLYGYEGLKQDEICFTLGYIVHNSEYKYIDPQYYFRLKGEIVLVYLDRGIGTKVLENINLTIVQIETETEFIDLHEEAKIVQKLFPTQLGGFTGTSEGAVICFSRNDNVKIFYEDSDAIFAKRTIYKRFPSGAVLNK